MLADICVLIIQNWGRRIYEGQLAVLGNHPVAAEIRHMRDQEQEHLDTFEDLLKYQVRLTLLSPLWNGAGSCWVPLLPPWVRRRQWHAP